MLARLFGALPQVPLVVYTDRAWRRRVRRGGELLLDGRYRYFLRLGAVAQRLPPLRPLTDVLDLALALIAGLRVAADLRRLDPPVLLVAPLDSGFSTIAAALAARLSRRPHLMMAFDLWEENAYSPAARRLGAAPRAADPRRSGRRGRLLREGRRALPRASTGRRCEVIATPIAAARHAHRPRRPPTSDPVEVLVGGAVYWAQEDAVRRLVRAAGRAPGRDRHDPRRRGRPARPRHPRRPLRAAARGDGVPRPAPAGRRPLPRPEPRLALPGRDPHRHARAARGVHGVGPAAARARPARLARGEYARSLRLRRGRGRARRRGARPRDLRAVLDDPERALERGAPRPRLAAERHAAPWSALRSRRSSSSCGEPRTRPSRPRARPRARASAPKASTNESFQGPCRPSITTTR